MFACVVFPRSPATSLDFYGISVRPSESYIHSCISRKRKGSHKQDKQSSNSLLYTIISARPSCAQWRPDITERIRKPFQISSTKQPNFPPPSTYHAPKTPLLTKQPRYFARALYTDTSEHKRFQITARLPMIKQVGPDSRSKGKAMYGRV